MCSMVTKCCKMALSCWQNGIIITSVTLEFRHTDPEMCARNLEQFHQSSFILVSSAFRPSEEGKA